MAREQTDPAASSVPYHGFMSYSHEADDLLAPRLQAGLQTFAKPWWKRRALRVFRDQASLSANPHLWSSIAAALDSSEWFIVLASPGAAASPWVDREVAYWLEHRDPNRILPVLTAGRLVWDEAVGRFDPSSAVPPSLLGAFGEEPRWVDLSWVEEETQLDMRNGRFRGAVADIASALRGVSKDDLESEEVRQHRRTRRTAWAAGTLLLVLAVAAVLGAVVAVEQRNEAELQRAAAEAETTRAIAAESLARSRELAASAINTLDDDAELSILLGLEAIEATPSGSEQPVEALNALREGVHASRLRERWLASPAQRVVFLDLSADGDRLAVVSLWDGTVALVDAGTGQELWKFSDPETVDNLFSVDLAPDGSVVAVGIFDSALAHPSLLPPISRPGADEGDDLPARIIILDAADGALIETIPYPCVEAAPVPRFSPDGSLLAVAGLLGADCRLEGDWEVELLNTDTFEPIRRVPAGGDRLVSWSADESILAVGGDFLPATRVIEVASGEPLLELEVGGGLLSPDGSRLIVDRGATALALLDRQTGQYVDILTGLNQLIASRYFSPDGSLLIVGTTGGHVAVFDVESGELLHRLGGDSAALSFACVDQCDTLYAGSVDGQIRAWDLSGSAGGEFNTAETGYFVNANSITVAGQHGVFLGFSFQGGNFPEAALFDGATGAMLGARRLTDFNQPTVLPDGRVVLFEVAESAPEYGPVVAWDPATDAVEEILGCWTTLEDAVQSGFGEEYSPPCVDRAGDHFVLSSAYLSPDLSTLLLASGGGEVRIFDTSSLEETSRLQLPPSLRAVRAFGGDWLLATDANVAHVLATADGAVLASLGIGSVGSWAEVSASGDLLVVAETQGKVVVHDTGTWQPIASFDTAAHTRGIALSPDGSKLLTANSDGYVRIWDTMGGRELTRIPVTGPSDGYWLDESHVVVGNTQGLWTTLTLDLEELIDLAVSRLTRSFTPEECQVYRIDPCPELGEIRTR